MSAVLNLSVEFVHMECGECGMNFAVTRAKYNRCKEKKEGWYCPNGHSRVFNESEVERLQKEIAKEKQRREWAERSKEYAEQSRDRHERRAIAYKGVATKIKKRVGNGVCPCCNRTFQNLMSHMKTKHPKFEGKVIEQKAVTK